MIRLDRYKQRKLKSTKCGQKVELITRDLLLIIIKKSKQTRVDCYRL